MDDFRKRVGEAARAAIAKAARINQQLGEQKTILGLEVLESVREIGKVRDLLAGS